MSLATQLVEHKSTGNGFFTKADHTNAVSAYSDGLTCYVEAKKKQNEQSSAAPPPAAAAAGEASSVLEAMGILHFPNGSVELTAAAAEQGGFSKEEASAVVTLLNNRAAALLGLCDQLMYTVSIQLESASSSLTSAEDTASEVYQLLTGAVQDTTAATDIIRAHYAWEKKQPGAIVPVAEPLVPTAQRAKIMFRRGRALQKMSRLERFLARILLVKKGGPEKFSNSNLESFLRRVRNANMAAMDALTLFRKALPISASSSPQDAAAVRTEIGLLRGFDVFPSAAFVHPQLDKVMGASGGDGDITTHGVGLLISAAEGDAAAISEDVVTQDDNAAAAPTPSSVLPRGTLLLREFPAIHVKDTTGQTYQQRFATAFQQMSETASNSVGSIAKHCKDWSAKMSRIEQLLSLHYEDAPFLEQQQQQQQQQTEAGGSSNDYSSSSSLEHLQFLLCDVWRRNAMKIAEIDFRLGEGDRGPEGVALYPDASRVNHSCRPNAVQYFDPQTGELTIRSLKELKTGDEVFISYVPPISPPLRKKEMLRFECKCEFCFGEDALGRHMEHIVCPGCQVTTNVVSTVNKSAEDLAAATAVNEQQQQGDSKTEKKSTPETRCAMCRMAIPLNDYLEAVDEKKKMATDLCLLDEKGDMEKEHLNRFKAVRILMGVEEGASLLAPCHYKRFEVRLETLAAAVGAPMTAEVSEQVVRLSKKTLAAADEILPSRWPLQTGLMMHHIMCYGRHFKSTINSTANDDEDDGDKKFDGDGNRKKNPFMTDDICRLLADAFEDHVILTGDENGVLQRFWKRYEMELAAIDIGSVEDFEAFMAVVMDTRTMSNK